MVDLVFVKSGFKMGLLRAKKMVFAGKPPLAVTGDKASAVGLWASAVALSSCGEASRGGMRFDLWASAFAEAPARQGMPTALCYWVRFWGDWF